MRAICSWCAFSVGSVGRCCAVVVGREDDDDEVVLLSVAIVGSGSGSVIATR